jgi:hypothetical protein
LLHGEQLVRHRRDRLWYGLHRAIGALDGPGGDGSAVTTL